MTEDSVNVPQPVQPDALAAPAYALYSVLAMTWATFLGSPLAGAILIAINYRRIAKPALARKTLWWGFIATAALIGCTYFIPDSWRIPNVLITIPMLIIFSKVAKQTQGETLAQHFSGGGRKASGWGATGIGIATAVVIVAMVVGVVLVAERIELGPGHAVNTNDVVHYKGQATPQDAQRVGEALEEAGYFTDNGVMVQLTISHEAVTLKLYLSSEAFRDSSLQELMFSLADDLPVLREGRPVVIRLANEDGEVQRERKFGARIAPADSL